MCEAFQRRRTLRGGFRFYEGNTGDFSFAGQYGIAPNPRLRSDDAESIEILRGQSEAISGVARNGAFGAVVPKQAGDDLTRVTMVGAVGAARARRRASRRPRYVAMIDRRRTIFHIDVENAARISCGTDVAAFGALSIAAPRTCFGSVSVGL